MPDVYLIDPNPNEALISFCPIPYLSSPSLRSPEFKKRVKFILVYPIIARSYFISLNRIVLISTIHLYYLQFHSWYFLESVASTPENFVIPYLPYIYEFTFLFKKRKQYPLSIFISLSFIS